MRQQLIAEGLELEEVGGSVQVVETAAPTGLGLLDLEEALMLQVTTLPFTADMQVCSYAPGYPWVPCPHHREFHNKLLLMLYSHTLSEFLELLSYQTVNLVAEVSSVCLSSCCCAPPHRTHLLDVNVNRYCGCGDKLHSSRSRQNFQLRLSRSLSLQGLMAL